MAPSADELTKLQTVTQEVIWLRVKSRIASG
jgi:hypothetical protein